MKNILWLYIFLFKIPHSAYHLSFRMQITTIYDENWVLFLLWLHPFILSGVISPLIFSSILGTYWHGEFLFQYPIILPFHTVHGLLKARILKWLAIPFSSGPQKRNAKGKIIVWGGLTNNCEKKISERQMRKGRHTHLNAEFQRIARSDKKAFLSDQWAHAILHNSLGSLMAQMIKNLPVK